LSPPAAAGGFKRQLLYRIIARASSLVLHIGSVGAYDLQRTNLSDCGEMDKKPRKKKARKVYQESITPPSPLDRAPRTDLAASVDELDRLAFEAVGCVASRLAGQIEQATSLRLIRLLHTQANMLLAMKSTHRSIRRLVSGEKELAELSVDALSLARVQLERGFLAMLLIDSQRWHVRYRKNAWKAFARKYFRDQRSLGHFEPYKDYFGSSGPGITILRQFAHEMDVGEDEIQTLRAHVLGDKPDPRWDQWFIADMPTPGRTVQELTDPQRKALAEVLHPYYDNLSHFTHGGLVGVMTAAILRGETAGAQGDATAGSFWQTHIVESTLPVSYAAMLLVATLFAVELKDNAKLIETLIGAWRPYHSDGSPLGIAIWDSWAARALGVEPGSDAEDGE